MLCKTCENLPPPTNVAGACRSCTANTAYFAYRLCEDCSKKLDQCERCEAPLNAPASSIVRPGPTAYRVTLGEQDNGKTVPGMRPGEEIAITLEEDQYSQTEWGPAFAHSSYFRLKANNGFTPYPGQYQKGTRELIFEISSTGQADLVLEEKVRIYSWYSSRATPSSTAASNGKTWRCTVISK